MLLKYLGLNTVKINQFFILFLVIVCWQEAASQHISTNEYSALRGIPQIIHYNRNDFHADPQFWSVCEGPDGVLYFGNNDGAIIFDGEQWQKVSLPNNSSIRCLAADKSGNIYAGGFNEFGLIKRDLTGQYYYSSIKDSLKFTDPKLENLWQVHILDNLIVYRSFSKLITIAGKKITKLPAGSNFIRSFVIDGQYYVQDQFEGIYKLNKEKLKLELVISSEKLYGEEIIAAFPAEKTKTWLGIGITGKVLEINLETKTSTVLRELFDPHEINRVECALEAKDGTYYVGTVSSGIITLNKKGDILNDVDTYNDLQDQSVLNLFQTNQGNIWALLNNGLDCITANSPVRTIFEGASLYDVHIKKNEVYLATNQGVFYSEDVSKVPPKFSKVKGLEGQGWSLQEYEGDILAAHDKGLFEIKENRITQISNITGVWKVIPIHEKEGYYLVATYGGLFLLSKSADTWMVHNKIEGFDESTRDILESKSPGTYWVCHGYKGVFRIKINDNYTKLISLEHFTTQNGFAFPYSINVFEWNNEIVFTSNQGIYQYKADDNQFIPYKPLNSVLDSTKNTRTLFQHLDKTWFVQDDEAGFFYNSDHTIEKGYFLQFKGAFNRGMECIIPLDSQKVLLGTKTGLYLFDLTYKNSHQQANTLITSVSYKSDQKDQYLPISPESRIQLPYNTASFSIKFAAPEMQNDADIQYAYKLENIDKKWSSWQLDAHKEYAHLRPGKYTFKVKSRSLLGTVGNTSSLNFEIMPLWYQTKWMILVYVILGTSLILITIRLVKRKINKENAKTRAEAARDKKLLELELEQLRLQAEKDKINKDKVLLEEDVLYKSKELANYTMMLVKKKDIFSEIRDDILELRRYVKNEISKKKIQNMYKKLNQHAIGEEYMHVFETNFEQVHHDFFTSLKTHYPDLSQRELRLCAFIKMNLTNKEISPLLNISVRGVETARYRLRKKMDLEHDANLTEYLESIDYEKA
jgi:DNA-binding CsgD family transcriptional regulator